MPRSFFVTVTALIAATFIGIGNAFAVDPVTVFATQYLVGKVVDRGWDTVTGKPDVEMIRQQLKSLEANAVMRGEMRDEIRKLRESIDNRVTREEFRQMAERAATEMASIQKRLNDLEERVEVLEVVQGDSRNRTQHATDAGFFVERGNIYESRNQFHKATACYNVAITLNPQNPSFYINRGQLYAKHGAPGVAVLDATEAIDLDRDNVSAFTLRASAYSQCGEFNLAIADYTELIALDKANATHYFSRAMAFHARGVARCNQDSVNNFQREKPDFVSALADFSECIRQNPTDPLGYVHRAETQLTLGDYLSGEFGDRVLAEKHYSNSIADTTAAIRLKPSAPDAYIRRAKAHAALAFLFRRSLNSVKDKSAEESYGRAVADLTTAIGLDQDNSLACELRAETYTSLGTMAGMFGKDPVAAKTYGDKATVDHAEAIRARENRTAPDLIVPKRDK